MVAVARAATLRGFRELAGELGADGTALLRGFDITPAAPDSDDAMISAEAIGRLLEAAAVELRCPDLGLRLAARQDATALGPLAVAVANAATAGDAITCASRFLFTHHTGISVAVVDDPEGRPGVVGLHYRDPGEATGFGQAIDLAAGIIHRFLRHGLGDEYGLLSVHLPHAALAPAASYREYFGCEVRFDTPTTVFRLPADLPDRPVPGSSAMLRTLAMDYLTKNFPDLGQTMVARVRLAIDRIRLDASTDIHRIAHLLSLPERTLADALVAEGTTFAEVLDAARRDTAHRLLRDTDLSMAQITAVVGLGDQSALTKAVRRWFGVTPLQVRSSARERRGDRRPRRTVVPG
ncbi:AraC family transcriptional regulator [Nocardia sp. 2]|uniref:AraC family transcriptional regulator n=1 Tax=Nocardia acididurans TaxID=2802282 RepID=A0ABS1M5R5_9NOCA|nr:AraC family transcriptional regulator [Nocardia acididurans]MBL1075982.1 AraC family transcriptional regulator [Nocardia acididurans]